MSRNFLISVIVSTYNRPDMLFLVLEALNRQTDSKFEVVIADDGSTEDTRVLIERMKQSVAFNLSHIWQPDDGFRKAAVLNSSVKSAKGDYLVFLDGDCVPPPCWVARHRDLAEKGWLVAGQRILASRAFTQELIENPSLLHTFEWTSKSLVRLWREDKINRPWPGLNWSLGFVRKLWSRDWLKVRGCNWAMWKADYVAVNGCDESFIGWGAEDSDLAVRLVNYGVSVKYGIFSAGVLHLWHQEFSRSNSEKNFLLVKQREIEKVIYPNVGLDHQEEFNSRDQK